MGGSRVRRPLDLPPAAGPADFWRGRSTGLIGPEDYRGAHQAFTTDDPDLDPAFLRVGDRRHEAGLGKEDMEDGGVGLDQHGAEREGHALQLGFEQGEVARIEGCEEAIADGR